jgi:chaperonin GroES
MQPLNDRVLIQRDAKQEKVGNILLPDDAQEVPVAGVVVAVGEGKLLDNGKRSKLTVKKGDRVIFSRYGALEVPGKEKEGLVVVREDDIILVLT